MVLKPGTGSFGTVCRCQVLLENKICISIKMSAAGSMKCSKLPVYGCVDLGPQKTQWDQHQQITWHPKPSLTVETLHWTSSNMDSVPLLSSPDSGTLISKGNAKFTFIREHNFDHSAAVQSRRFWRCLLFKSGLTQGMRQLKPMSCICLCVVVLEALTPAAVHSCESPPHFWMGFVSQSSPGCGYPYCLYTFSTTFFPSLRPSINAWTQSSVNSQPLCNDLLCLALLVQGVNGRLLDNCQVSSLPHDCVAYRTRLTDHLKALQVFWVN